MKVWLPIVLFGVAAILLLWAALQAYGAAPVTGNADQPGTGGTGTDTGGDVGIDPNEENVDAKIEDIIYRVAVAEGFFVSGSRPQRNNNPGDLMIAGDNGQDDAGYGIFSSASQTSPYTGTGWDAARNQWRLIFTGTSRVYSPSMTWAQVAQLYDQGGDWQNWLANVGMSAGQTVSDWLAS